MEESCGNLLWRNLARKTAGVATSEPVVVALLMTANDIAAAAAIFMLAIYTDWYFST